MKIRNVVTLAAISMAVLLAGCVVTSVYPFYTAKDLAFEPALMGTWSEHGAKEDKKDIWEFAKAGEKAYWLTTMSEAETNYFEAHLFRLRGKLFLDFCPTNRVEGQLPLHYLLKVARIEPSLQFQLLNYEWLAKLVEEKPAAIRHIIVPQEPGTTNNKLLILTADTAELQKFVLKWLNDTNAFGDTVEIKKWKE